MKGSHPTWVRGLKLKLQTDNQSIENVASYMGAWIETSYTSHHKDEFIVASYMGAWIETDIVLSSSAAIIVASYMGAWIET